MFINDYSHYHLGLFYIMRTPAGGETNIRAVLTFTISQPHQDIQRDLKFQPTCLAINIGLSNIN